MTATSPSPQRGRCSWLWAVGAVVVVCVAILGSFREAASAPAGAQGGCAVAVGSLGPALAGSSSAYDGQLDVARNTTECPAGIGATAFAEMVDVAADVGTTGDTYDSSASFVAPRATRHLCSFSGGTEVLMADGTSKPISEVEVGDRVLAEDPETGERGARQVTHLWVHQDTIIDLGIDGHDVATTEDHPFWNHTDGEWQRADALDIGDLVVTADGGLLSVDGIDWRSARTTTAYNLTVDGIHTYFVEVGTDEVLVHNTGDGLCGLGESIVRHIPEDRALNGVTQPGRAGYIDDVLASDLTDHRILDPVTGRQAWFDPELENVIIYDPTSATGGTAFPRPGGRDWFWEVLE